MLVRVIRDFLELIKPLIKPENPEHPLQVDSEQLKAINDHFVKRLEREILNEKDYAFLLACFATRWDSLKDSDYWADSHEKANDLWINLAKTLAPQVKKSYIQILFPKISDAQDFNNKACLAETQDPKHLYFSTIYQVLYTREGLVQHLIEHDFQLSTYRSNEKIKLMPLAIDELSQLKKTKNKNEPLTIGDEQFAHFWEFLGTKVLVKLNPGNRELPVELFVHLLQLIEHYFVAKKQSAGKKKEEQEQAYAVFKTQMSQFYSLLMTLEFDIVNSFYGYIIKPDPRLKHPDLYILDYLIQMNRASGFVLDESLRSLVNALVGIHPGFYSMQQKFMPCYTQHRKSIVTGHSDVVPRTVFDLEKCQLMLLSLFTKDLPKDIRISLWDQSHLVFAEAQEIYAKFHGLIEENNYERLAETYKTIYKDFIRTYTPNSSLSLLSLFRNSSATDEWYAHAKTETFNQLDIYWYEPELLIHALLRFKTTRIQLIKDIEAFLDGLIRTYAQAAKFSVLQKEFRVNILFHSFFSKLEQEEKHNLLTVLQIYPLADAKTFFLANSAHYIVNRLHKLSTNEPIVSMRFFAANIQAAQQDIFEKKTDRVSAIITRYLNSEDIKDNKNLCDYLDELQAPIYTQEEWLKIKNTAEDRDYHGAPR